MSPIVRLAVVAALLAGVAVVTLWYRRRAALDAGRGVVGFGGLPAELYAGAPTWVIFTTPVCASCAAVEALLRQAFPHHEVVKVDATERPDLADAYEVRRAPTTLFADANGRVLERLVGPEAVRDFVGTADVAARTA